MSERRYWFEHKWGVLIVPVSWRVFALSTLAVAAWVCVGVVLATWLHRTQMEDRYSWMIAIYLCASVFLSVVMASRVKPLRTAGPLWLFLKRRPKAGASCHKDGA